MGKLYLFYKKPGDSLLGNTLKVKIDDAITTEVPKNSACELELADGAHNIKMYTEGWTKDELVGYIDQTVVIAGDSFFQYRGPITLYGKGRLEKLSCPSPEVFKKRVQQAIKWQRRAILALLFAGLIALAISEALST